MIETVALVVSVVLAMACVAILGGPLGLIAWFCLYGLFRLLARVLLKIVG
jgi:hypothetical protein